MGEYSLINQLIELQAKRFMPEFYDDDDWPRLTRFSRWRTQDGRLIRVCDMENTHVVNLLLCLWGFGKSRIRGSAEMLDRWERVVTLEAERRGLSWSVKNVEV